MSCFYPFKILERGFIKAHLHFIISGLATFSGFLTYAIVSYGGVSWAKRTSIVMPFITFDALIIVMLTIVIIYRLKAMYHEQKRGVIGARLHITIIIIFSLVTIIPSMLMGVLAITFFKSGVAVWFSQPVQHTLNEASLVAELYLQEHIRNICSDAISFADRLNMPDYDFASQQDCEELREKLDEFVEKMRLEEALIKHFRKNKGPVSVSSSLAIYLELDSISYDTDMVSLGKVCRGDVVIKEKNDQVQAQICVDRDSPDAITYLWVSKRIDSNILKYVNSARDSTRYYNELIDNQNKFQVILITLFAMASFLLLLAAIWIGITLANIVVEPITHLIVAANDVSEGNFSVRVPEVHPKNELNKLVLSFNRMTERLARQNKDLIISEKKSAWADIARKIAHEVKNPLTPIQLSAERLKRKYKAEIRSDPDTFIKCIDTIIRQVSHIENLISEFSAFARMPEANIQPVNMNHLARDAVFLQKQVDSDIEFIIQASHPLIIWPCDSQQIFQVLVNLLQNSVNAIKERDLSLERFGEKGRDKGGQQFGEQFAEKGGGKFGAKDGDTSGERFGERFAEKIGTSSKRAGGRGTICVVLEQQADCLFIIIEDDGPGFPVENRERLFEPYYTTRSKGTGLGMSIVLRIVTEHAGFMELKDAVGHQGARIEIILPNNRQ
ncbi:MAG: HAMP domain-containing protein [Holosporales bacterium]|jgi:two-component system nitrogen regulation sensor histidine kinase NtrY|nr:HAMP domain-containing protein [Holosporales bacterium]